MSIKIMERNKLIGCDNCFKETTALFPFGELRVCNKCLSALKKAKRQPVFDDDGNLLFYKLGDLCGNE